MGRLVFASIATKAISRTTAPTSSATIWVEPQPLALPRTSAKTSANRPAEKVTRPAQSIGSGFGERDSRTIRMVIAIAAMPTGRLT